MRNSEHRIQNTECRGHRSLIVASLFCILCSFLLASSAFAQHSGKSWAPASTPDGQPDLQGIWSLDTITYEFTVSDSTAFTKPWSAQIPMKRTEEPIFEYACHEGNYALTGVLAGARADDKRNEKGER